MHTHTNRDLQRLISRNVKCLLWPYTIFASSVFAARFGGHLHNNSRRNRSASSRRRNIFIMFYKTSHILFLRNSRNVDFARVVNEYSHFHDHDDRRGSFSESAAAALLDISLSRQRASLLLVFFRVFCERCAVAHRREQICEKRNFFLFAQQTRFDIKIFVTLRRFFLLM